MKKSILVLATAILVSGSIFTSCNTPAEKVENAQDKVIEANEDLTKANEEYLEDIEKYRRETAAKIDANNQSIAEFKARKENEKKEARAEYKEKIAELEQKNTDMKKKLDDYQAEGKDNWDKFKVEFNRDMDELGQSFKDFSVKNTK